MIRLDTDVTVTPVTSPELSPSEKAMSPFLLPGRKHRRGFSSELLLPGGLLSPVVGKAHRRRRWPRLVFLAVVLASIALFAHDPRLRDEVKGRVSQVWRAPTCEEQDLLTPAVNDTSAPHRLVVRVRSSAATGPAVQQAIPENTLQSRPLHPSLSDELANMFSLAPTPYSVDWPPGEACIRPESLRIPFHPRPVVKADRQPELFFALSTPPNRAFTYSSVWTHYMLPPNASTLDPQRPPGCLVTDAAGTGDIAGMARANDEFKRQGLGCVMRDSAKTGQRYEVRVLSLLREAWIEAAQRTRRFGARDVEWFIFGDDDTWWSDPVMLREFVSRHDYRDDHIFGTFSETRANYESFGRIAYGGGGIIISRSLLEKMQARLDECNEKFSGFFGGDGMITNCAALIRQMPLGKVVEETKAMRQMDVRGDATGYMTDGSAPFMSLHHWTSWLKLIPGVDGRKAIGLMSAAANAVGGNNFLRRWVFDNGAVTWSVGYAITVHKSALSTEQLGRIEWTWDDHAPRKEARPRLVEGIEKHTFYLTEVRDLAPDVYLFRHKCANRVLRDGINEIDMIWDARDETAAASSSSWRSRWLPNRAVSTPVRSYARGPALAPPLEAPKALRHARAFSG